jgi:predicted component of type VI protein secretion system
MGLFDRPARVRVAVYIEAEQRDEIQRIANAEDATASQVHRAALEYGLPELRKALQHGRHPSSRSEPVLPEVPAAEAAPEAAVS